jgi:hypothetical protein
MRGRIQLPVIEPERLAHFNSEAGLNQTHASESLWARMVHTSGLGEHADFPRLERYAQSIPGAAVRQPLLRTSSVGSVRTFGIVHVCEDGRHIVGVDIVSLASARRKVRELRLVAACLVELQPREEKLEELLL